MSGIQIMDTVATAAYGANIKVLDKGPIGQLFVSQDDGYSAMFVVRGGLGNAAIDGPFNATGGTVWSATRGTNGSNNLFLADDGSYHMENDHRQPNATYKCFFIGVPTS